MKQIKTAESRMADETAEKLRGLMQT
jgi:hypothetical protein